jgi:hypothetical protein
MTLQAARGGLAKTLPRSQCSTNYSPLVCSHVNSRHGSSRQTGASASRPQRTVLAGLVLSCDNPFMTTTVDQKHRAVTPFKPGDVLEIEQPSADVVVLKRTKQAAGARPKLVRRNGRLVFVGEATTTEEVKRLLEDFP